MWTLVCGIQPADPTSASVIALTVGLGTVALAVYGAGVSALCRTIRSRRR